MTKNIRAQLQTGLTKLRTNLPIQPKGQQTSTEPKPKRKALLIGIQYTTLKENALMGPHRDVAAMKKLLIDKYHYKSKDIVTLIDTEDSKQKQPTQANILYEMECLVQDARAGDRFFFHYAGHATQVQNEDNTEEDGMDECIVPSDCNGTPDDPKLIKDDVLKKILVDRLPSGAQLMAIFDSCHSASLLDLEHFRCNRVYVPWVSKGLRRNDSKRRDNVRRNAGYSQIQTVLQTTRMNENGVTTHKASIDCVVPEKPNRISISTRPNSPHVEFATPSPASGSRPRKHSSTRTQQSAASSHVPGPWFSDEVVEMVESPVDTSCDGFCRNRSGFLNTAHRRPTHASGNSPFTYAGPPNVMSLGSCKDSQIAWEDLDGSSMTQVLVELLRKDPNPTLQNFMTCLSHTLHDRLLKIHKMNKDYYSERKRWEKERTLLEKLNPLKKKKKGRARDPEAEAAALNALEMTNFQDPQLSSDRPLDMTSKLQF